MEQGHEVVLKHPRGNALVFAATGEPTFGRAGPIAPVGLAFRLAAAGLTSLGSALVLFFGCPSGEGRLVRRPIFGHDGLPSDLPT
jgi:hypothetical protein